jgi:hypothetical protein
VNKTLLLLLRPAKTLARIILFPLSLLCAALKRATTMDIKQTGELGGVAMEVMTTGWRPRGPLHRHACPPMGGRAGAERHLGGAP